MKFAPRLSPAWFKARIYHITAPLVALAIVWLLQQTQLVALLENLTVSLRFKARASFDPPADSRLFFIAIDQQSIDFFGAWPWSRTIEAGFLERLAQAPKPPHTVAFDLLFTEPLDKLNTGASGVDPLGEKAGLLPSVITGALSIRSVKKSGMQEAAELRTLADLAKLGMTQPLTNIVGNRHQIFGSDVAIFPVPSLRENSFFGFVDADPNFDGIRHTVPLLVRIKDQVFPSFALQILCQTLHVDSENVLIDLPGLQVRLTNSSHKSWSIPINEKGEFAINYRAQESFRGGSFIGLFSALETRAQALSKLAPGSPPPPPLDDIYEFGNKVMVVGQDATGLTDMGPTPLDSQAPLVCIHLNIINNVLSHDYLRFVPRPTVVLCWLILSWITLLRIKDANLLEAVFVPMFLMVLYTVVAFAIFWKWSLQIDLAWPILAYVGVNFGGVVLRWREEQMAREQIKKLFSQMLSPEVLKDLLDNPEKVKLDGGSMRRVTTLFSDIRDYTHVSEGQKPAELVRQLNIYFARMVHCVKEHRGTFHKFIGDAVMSAWGDIERVSQGGEQDARNAVRSALMMRRRLRELNREREGQGLVPLRIGIGLNHGEVLVGLIGDAERFEFTVMGDHVNTASRLEGMTKEFHTDLAISESVRNLLGDEFLVRRLGLVQLKGMTVATLVYEVLSEMNDLADSKLTPDVVVQYEAAFDHFLARRFAEAEAGFLACEEKYPDDYCVEQYLHSARDFLREPPDADWDGRIVMKTK